MPPHNARESGVVLAVFCLPTMTCLPMPARATQEGAFLKPGVGRGELASRGKGDPRTETRVTSQQGMPAPAAATPLNTAEAIARAVKVADEVRVYRRASTKEVLLAVMNRSQNSRMLQLTRKRTGFVQARRASPVLPNGRWLVHAGDSSYTIGYHFETGGYHFETGWLLGSRSAHAAIPDTVKHWLWELAQKDRRQHNRR